MKKMVFGIAMAIMLASALALGSKSGPIKDKHKGLKGKDGASVNCVYCHTKAGNPKTKGNDLAKLKKGAYCKISGCH